ncbi:hypothetical protein CLIB1423_01S09274 [[Candida] railenensis]|uniref:Uncharacterized protein n=1 Tax=[Candida] railenensis TaxID=45579 RepID=A0A9P0QL50_9ASCO|nr:hypothetical protein CLIB1423_01S09274 [[Candida] railenensis]
MIRSSANIRSENVANKRHKSEQEGNEDEKTYTQGPLDEIFGQHPAFPLSTDVDIEGEDVMKYLAEVRQEAEADRHVHFVERERSVKKERELASQPEINEPRDDPSSAAARLAWKEDLMRAFLLLKEEVDTHKHRIEMVSSSKTYNLPETAASWRKYIFEKNTGPSIELLFNSVDHATAIKLLIYCTQWLSTNTPANLSKWIYMLFLRLDNLLDHSEFAIVRGLAKKAIKLREKPDLSSVSSYTIEMVIVIVGEYYRQRDLLIVLEK